MKPTLLVVDDKPNMLSLLAKRFGGIARVVTAEGVIEALGALEREPVSAVLCDLRMNDGDGLDVLRAVRTRWPAVRFVLMTAHASVATAVQAMRDGAHDYVTKPFEAEQLRAVVERALAEGASARGAEGDGGPEGLGRLVGRAPAMRALYQLIERIAPTDATVLVLGETGTGKELVARAIHERSNRAAERMVAINCAAIPRSLVESELFGHAKGAFTGAASDRAGIFEEAHGSTLLLDEIGELRLSLQAKLTRVLEEKVVRRIGEARERRVDVRLVAATHRDLRAMVRAGTFREDLWFRLNVCRVDVPALRDRASDIPYLAQRFLAERAPLRGAVASHFASDALARLTAYRWPGNVRELRSAVERAVILADGPEIPSACLPEEVRDAGQTGGLAGADLATMTYREAADASRDEATRRYLSAVLARFGGDVGEAAKHAGVERESFYRMLRRAGLSAGEFRGEREPGEGTKS